MDGLEPMVLEHDGARLQGWVAVPEGAGPFPTVMVMHSAMGIAHQVEGVARKLAAMGYLAVATDMYGVDFDPADTEGAGNAYLSLHERSGRLRERAVCWFEAIAARDDVDAGRIAAIGYCLGGKCVLELARSGADVKAVVSFHGILASEAPAQPGAVRGYVAAYCGSRDPFAPLEQISALQQELIDAGVRFEVTVFGEVEHGFTDHGAANLGRPGISYDATADRVSWAGTLALLEEKLRG